MWGHLQVDELSLFLALCWFCLSCVWHHPALLLVSCPVFSSVRRSRLVCIARCDKLVLLKALINKHDLHFNHLSSSAVWQPVGETTLSFNPQTSPLPPLIDALASSGGGCGGGGGLLFLKRLLVGCHGFASRWIHQPPFKSETQRRKTENSSSHCVSVLPLWSRYAVCQTNKSPSPKQTNEFKLKEGRMEFGVNKADPLSLFRPVLHNKPWHALHSHSDE